MAEGGDVPMEAEGDPTLPSLSGCEPPGSARPGSGSVGQTGGRNSAPLLVMDRRLGADLDREGVGFHIALELYGRRSPAVNLSFYTDPFS